MSKGDVVVDTGAWFASRAGSIPGGNVRFFFWKVRLLFNYDNQNYITSDMSKGGVLVNTVTWILSRAGSILGAECTILFWRVRLLFCKVLCLFFDEHDFVSFITN